jgi:hypothetical protein
MPTYINKEINDVLFNIHLTRDMRVVCRQNNGNANILN